MKHIGSFLSTLLLTLLHGASLATEGDGDLDTGGVQDVGVPVLGGAGCLKLCPTFCVTLSSAVLCHWPGKNMNKPDKLIKSAQFKISFNQIKHDKMLQMS